MSDASPRPWSSVATEHWRIRDANGEVLADTWKDMPMDAADAALIVRAVNSHKDLREALDDCLRVYESEHYVPPDPQDCLPGCGDCRKIKFARAALAAAR